MFNSGAVDVFGRAVLALSPTTPTGFEHQLRERGLHVRPVSAAAGEAAA